MLVLRHDERLAFLLRYVDPHDLLGHAAVGDRRCCALLAAQREGILIRATYRELLRHVLRRLGHRIDAVARLEKRIDEAPADRRVFDLRASRESFGRLAHHERRARHAFDATGDDEAMLAGFDRARGDRHRVEARAAQAVDRRAGY